MIKQFTFGKHKIDILNSKDNLVPIEASEVKLSIDDKNALALAINKDIPTLLIGETGTGKSSIIKYLAYKRKQPYVRVNLNGYTTPDELIGRVQVKDGQTYFENGIITDAMQKGAILVLDEINATSPDCLFILHGLLDQDKQITLPNGLVVKPQENFRVFATCNPDYEGTKSMNKAFIDRFGIVLGIKVLTPSKEIDLLINRTGISKDLATKLVTIATMARKDYIDNKIGLFISTRSLLRLSQLIIDGLEIDVAFKTAIIQKTQDSDEQKVLRDFYMAVFKQADKTADANDINDPTPIVITQGQLNHLSVNYGNLRDSFDKLYQDTRDFTTQKNDLLDQVKSKEYTINELTEANNKLAIDKTNLEKQNEAYKTLEGMIKGIQNRS